MVQRYPLPTRLTHPDFYKASLYPLSSSPADSLAVSRTCQAQPSLRNFPLAGMCPQNVGWLSPFFPPFSDVLSVPCSYADLYEFLLPGSLVPWPPARKLWEEAGE